MEPVKSRRIAPFVLFLLAAASLACATSAAPPTVTLIPSFGPPATPTESPATPTSLPVPEGWNRFDTSDGKASIAIPPGWVFIEAGTQEAAATVAKLAETNQDASTILDRQLTTAIEQKISLFAADLTEETLAQGYVTNLSIVRRAFDVDITLDEFAATNHRSIAKAVGEEALTEKRQVIAGHKGGAFLYGANVQIAETVNRDIWIAQYFLLGDPRTIYMITFGCPYDQFEAKGPLFEEIMATLALLPE